MTSYLGFGIPGGWEIWIILVIFLLLFGHRIPSMARAMGSGIVEFKKGLKDPGESDGKDGSDGKDDGSSSESASSGSAASEKQTQDSGSAKG